MNDFIHTFTEEEAGTTYSDVLDLSEQERVTNVEATLDLTVLDGTGTVDVTPQYSYDQVRWFDHTLVFTQLSAVGSETLDMNTTGIYMRFKIVVTAGTDPVATGKIYAVAK